jgi:hypothetical protein
MRWSRFTSAAIALALACLGAQAADADDHRGLLFQAEADGHRMMVCVQNREGRFYTVVAPNSEDIFFTFHTRYMARPKGDAAPDALSGVWQIGQDSDQLSEPRRDASIIDMANRMELQASGPNRWSGTLHHQATPYPAPKWADTPITLTQIASDCGAFEDQRLKLPWQPDGRPETGADDPNAVRYRTLKHPATRITRIELLPSRVLAAAPARRINAQIEQLTADMIDDWSGCKDYDASIYLIDQAPRLVRLQQDIESECGGMHSNTEHRWFTFDLQTGERVELNTWFIDAGRPLPAGLWRLLAKANPDSSGDDAECLARVKREGTDGLLPWLTADGMQFRYVEEPTYPPILDECQIDFAPLPYKAVRPFIKPERRKAFDAYVNSFASARACDVKFAINSEAYGACISNINSFDARAGAINKKAASAKN